MLAAVIGVFSLIFGYAVGANTHKTYLVYMERHQIQEIREVRPNANQLAPFQKNIWGEWDAAATEYDQEKKDDGGMDVEKK